ncbi:hypothetical protein AB0L59_35670 [Streptomyces sp. NPDC052109]|uniref:hypothetical protein n=1 Tax=Streptomyces sp. NPDC052109 TaxID=3155527 RepID=UPI0034307BED
MVTSYTYTPAGQVTTMSDNAGNKWSYNYDLARIRSAINRAVVVAITALSPALFWRFGKTQACPVRPSLTGHAAYPVISCGVKS